MKKCLFTILLFSFFLGNSSLFAQLSFSTGADIQSRYVWRGQALGGNAPCIEPGATLSYGGLSLDLWGAFSLNSSEYQELDWTLSYTFLNEMIRLQVTDYSFPNYNSLHHYFDYKANTTEHVMEAGLLFSVPSTSLSLALYTNFYGADARDINGEMVYSTYAELVYDLECESISTDFNFALGCAFNGKSGYSFYGNDGFGIVNICVGATRKLEITPSFSLPIYGQVIANPVADKMFLVCGSRIEL